MIARSLLALVCLSHLVILVFTLTHQEQAVTRGTTIVLAVHIPLFLLTGFLAFALSSGHPWVLRPATVSQAFGIAFSTVSTPPFDALRPLVPLMIAGGISIIILLWAPPSSRAFFIAHPRSRRSRRNAAQRGAGQPAAIPCAGRSRGRMKVRHVSVLGERPPGGAG
ncbi:MAG TPA: hypothetical protein VGD91_15310 [Trebonia sp.]